MVGVDGKESQKRAGISTRQSLVHRSRITEGMKVLLVTVFKEAKGMGVGPGTLGRQMRRGCPDTELLCTVMLASSELVALGVSI